MKKQTKYFLVGSFILISCFILADYFSLLGTHKRATMEMVELHFKTVDKASGAPVDNVHIRCFQKGNDNACAEKESPGYGIVAVAIPLIKIITKSILFRQEVDWQEPDDPKLHIMFIHHDYDNPVKTLRLNEIMSMTSQIQRVEMPKTTLR